MVPTWYQRGINVVLTCYHSGNHVIADPSQYEYLLYVNDIGNASDCEILSFADDTTLILSDPDLKCLYEKSNVEINKLYTWFCTNKLQLNANKTEYIVIKTPQKHCDFEGLNLQINGIPFEQSWK